MRVQGEVVKGHFCYDCLPFVDKATHGEGNRAKTDVCRKCEHRREGVASTAMIGDWLIMTKSKGAAKGE